MKALRIHAGPLARAHIERHGLQAADIGLVAGAAGGPKGLILGPLDRFVFGRWLPQATQPVHLLGASIGAWRMATAAMPDPAAAFARFERAYIEQHYEPEPGRKMPSAARVSQGFRQALDAFFAAEVEGILQHPRYRVPLVTTRGRHVLAREGRLRTPVGYLGLALSNAVSRRALNLWAERVVFSAPGAELPLDLSDLNSRRVPLSPQNFHAALQASCSIPFVLQAVHDIPGAPRGAYWDGGITDYHLHWRYRSLAEGAQRAGSGPAGAASAAQGDPRPTATDAARHAPADPIAAIARRMAAASDAARLMPPGGHLVLYPHFQRSLVPGWLDKALRRRHRPTPGLDNVIVLAPDADWVARLPRGKLPDRNDFAYHGQDTAARVRDWSRAVAEAERLADEFAHWLDGGMPLSRVEPL